jgi:oligosaccharide repeat unit polymerase
MTKTLYTAGSGKLYPKIMNIINKIVSLTALSFALISVASLPVVFGITDDEFRTPWLASSFCVFLFWGFEARRSRSLISPLGFMFWIWAIRFFLPAAIFSPNTDLHPAISLVGMATPDDFFLSGILANASVIAVQAGFLLALASPRTRPPRAVDGREFPHRAAFVATCLGLLSLITFIALNGSILEFATTGDFRSTEIRGGSGYFFYASIAAIPGSVYYFYYRVNSERSIPIDAIFVILVVSVTFIVLGGRVRALLPVLCAILIFAHMKGWTRPSLTSATLAVGGVTMTLFVMAALSQYRGAGLVGVANWSLDELVTTVSGSLIAEFGQLQSIFVALKSGEGMLGGSTYGILAFPFSDMLGWGSRNTGVLLIELAQGVRPSWALHATAVGDAVLNFGRWFVPVHCLIVGVILAVLERLFKEDRIHLGVYLLLSIYMLRAFFEATDKMQEVYVAAAFSWSIYALTPYVSPKTTMRRASNPRRPIR